MCGRATLTTEELETVAKTVESAFSPSDAELYRPRYNLAPTDLHFIVRQAGAGRALVPAKWGFTGTGRPLLINVRAETAAQKFKGAFEKRRCLIPVDGFYEWTGAKKTKHPVWVHTPDKEIFLLAGLYEEREGERPAFTILTTEPNRLLAPLHDRMPAIIPNDKATEWLSAPVPVPYLPAPAPEKLLVTTDVSPRANSVQYDDEACLTPWTAPKVKNEQLKLL